MRATTAAHSSRSPRYLGKIRPRLVASIWWPGPADALDAAGDAARALDLDDQVDGAHVHPELQAAGGHQAGQAAGLELLLDEQALLAGQAAVVGAGHLLLGQLVEPQGQPLGQPPVVDEHDRGAVGPHQLQDLGVHRRPDRAPGPLGARELDGVVADRRGRVGQLAHVLHRHPHLEVEVLGPAGVDHRHRARAALGVLPAQEPGDLGQRPLRGREADALHLAPGDPVQALQAEGQVRPPLGGRHRVDLVDDDRPGALEDRLARARSAAGRGSPGW